MIQTITKKRLNLILLALCILCISGTAFSQESLRAMIQGEKGKSQPLTRVNATQQISFNKSNLHDLLGLDAETDLQLISEDRDDLGVNYRFRELIHGIPVENTMYLIQTKNNNITALSGDLILEADPTMEQLASPTLNQSSAIQNAINQVRAVRYAWEDNSMEQRVREQNNNVAESNRPTAELVWYTPNESLDARNLVLAYKVIVYALEPLSREAIFIDASSGQLIGRRNMLWFSDATGTAATAYSGTQTIHSDLSGTSYRLRDLTKGSGVVTLHGETSSHTDYTSTTANFSYTTNDKYALDAHYGVSQTYDFYKSNFNRNSINNAGFALTSYANETATVNNAYWDGSIMHFGVRSGTSAGITGIDVAAHELTHGLTQYTSNLNYSNESGAMNESMSDIFGKAVQFWSKPTDINWLLSNDMNWAIRNMANPKQYSQPNCYQGTYWYTGSSDNGGVHTNSGVGNYFYYLLVNGGAATNDKGNAYTVTGLGLTTANAIIYRSETVYLTSTSNYASWRTACINAATDLYGAASNEVTQVQNAWYAVGVGTAGGGTTPCSTPSGLTSSALSNTGATLAWSNTGATTYNLQWKAATASTWTTVSGLTATSYSLSGLVACTGYQFQIQGVCATGSSAYSTATSFTTTGCTGAAYCTSSGTTGYEYINRVAIGTINNTSGNNSGYRDYTSLATNLAGGAATTITLVPGFVSSSYKEYWVVWIDYNHNGVFTDAGEKVATGNGTGSKALTFTVPATALNGATRMRVQMKYGSATTSSCGSYSYGEVEDYTVNITGNAQFTSAGSQSNLQSDAILYPNPVSDKLNYELISEVSGKLILSVFNITGQWIKSSEFYINEGKNHLDLTTSDLAEGLYLLRINGDQNAVYRFQIIR